MTTRTVLSSLLLTGLVAMSPAFGQETTPTDPAPPATETPDPGLDADADADAGTDVIAEVIVNGQGEAAISDALANALVETGAAADMDLATAAVLDLRAQGMGWGEVARELGFNLGHEVSAVRSEGRATAARASGTVDTAVEGAVVAAADETAPVTVDIDNNGVRAGADTAASARAQGEVGRAVAADARVNARVDAGASVSGRPVGVGQVLRPERPERAERPQRPQRPERPTRPIRGGLGL